MKLHKTSLQQLNTHVYHKHFFQGKRETESDIIAKQN